MAKISFCSPISSQRVASHLCSPVFIDACHVTTKKRQERGKEGGAATHPPPLLPSVDGETGGLRGVADPREAQQAQYPLYILSPCRLVVSELTSVLFLSISWSGRGHRL